MRMKPKKLQKTSDVKIMTMKRRNFVMTLRTRGYSLRRIAAMAPAWAEKNGIKLPLNYCFRQVYQDIERELMKIDRHNKELADHVFEIDQETLYDLQVGVIEEALKGDVLKIDRVLKIMARRHRLWGLDAPIRAEIEGNITLTVKDLHELLAEEPVLELAVQSDEDLEDEVQD